MAPLAEVSHASRPARRVCESVMLVTRIPSGIADTGRGLRKEPFLIKNGLQGPRRVTDQRVAPSGTVIKNFF